MLEMLRSRCREPSAVYLGGGENSKEISKCRELACRWIVERILHIMGDDKARVGVSRWEQLKIN